MKLRVRVAQLIVERSLDNNVKKMLETIDSSEKHEWVIFPEGMLSGYFPEDDQFMRSLNQEDIHHNIKIICERAKIKECNCIFGTILREEDSYLNVSVICRQGQETTYEKCNLSLLDRKWFRIGNKLNVFSGEGYQFGVQMCRELSFPEQWKVLKHKGAEVIFHINNSIQSYDGVRKNILVSRAFENQLFVCSVNNAASQALPSLVTGPLGEVLYESRTQNEESVSVEIDLKQVKNDFLSQERNDLVKLSF